MMHRYSNDTQTRWDKCDFKVQLLVPGDSRPIVLGDGTCEDLAELASLAESQGEGAMGIGKKRPKTGREIWTLGES